MTPFSLHCKFCTIFTFTFSFRAKLAEANAKITQLYAELDRMGHDRKSTFQHDKQLEELRNIQVPTCDSMQSKVHHYSDDVPLVQFNNNNNNKKPSYEQRNQTKTNCYWLPPASLVYYNSLCTDVFSGKYHPRTVTMGKTQDTREYTHWSGKCPHRKAKGKYMFKKCTSCLHDQRIILLSYNTR